IRVLGRNFILRPSPSPPLGAERVGVRWGIRERLPIPTSPSHAFGAGPSLSPLEGGEGNFGLTHPDIRANSAVGVSGRSVSTPTIVAVRCIPGLRFFRNS